MALLAVAFVALTILAAATDHVGDAAFFAILGAITVVALVGSRRFILRWLQRRPAR